MDRDPPSHLGAELAVEVGVHFQVGLLTGIAIH
jgi:hypothetical protein